MLNISNRIAINSQRLLGFKSLCSFLFDGTNEFFVIDSVLPSVLTNTTGAFLMVIKPEDSISPENKRIISFSDTQGITNITVTKTTSGLLSVGCVNGAGTRWNIRTDSEVFSDTTWVTACLVQDGVTPKIYINGVFVSQSIISSVDLTAWFNDCPNLDNGRIGCLDFNNAGNSQFWDGAINQVSILDTDISAAQVLEWHNDLKPKNPKTLFGDNCVYFEKFDDAIWDSVNNEYGLFDAVNPVVAKKSFVFDGVNENLIVDDLLTNISTDIKGTLLLVCSPTDSTPSTTIRLMSFGETGGTSFISCAINNAGKITFGCGNALGTRWNLQTDNKVVFNNTWTTIALVQDGVEPAIYVNGTLVAQSFITNNDSTIWFNGTPLLDNVKIGSLDYNSGGDIQFFDGNINQIGVLNDEISAGEVTTWHNNGNPLDSNVLFPTKSEFFFNPQDGVYSGGNYTVEDTVNSVTATSLNMEEEDLRYRAPNVGYSVNMEEEDKDCTENPY